MRCVSCGRWYAGGVVCVGMLSVVIFSCLLAVSFVWGVCLVAGWVVIWWVGGMLRYLFVVWFCWCLCRGVVRLWVCEFW